MDIEKAKNILQHVVRLLVDKEDARLYEEDYDKEGNFQAFRKTIDAYDGALTFPADKAFDDLDLSETDEAYTLIEFYLWVDNAPSDLMLALFIIQIEDAYHFTIEDVLSL